MSEIHNYVESFENEISMLKNQAGAELLDFGPVDQVILWAKQHLPPHSGGAAEGATGTAGTDQGSAAATTEAVKPAETAETAEAPVEEPAAAAPKAS